MDGVERVHSYLSNWKNGGELECREYLRSPHTTPNDPTSVDLLTTTYHTLLTATLSTFSPKHALEASSFIVFITTVLDELPSSSIETSAYTSSNAQAFGELMVDLVWSIEEQFEDILADVKAATVDFAVEIEKTEVPASETHAKALSIKQSIIKDLQSISSCMKQLLTMRVVSLTVCSERLSVGLLEKIGIVQDLSLYTRRETRLRTNFFYKQNKYNLLREQSQGYSKLTSELTSNLGPAHSPGTGRSTEEYHVIASRARHVWETVISLIGHFGLDPNRALDVVLDVFSVHIATHHTFFTALLSFTPWAGSFRPPRTQAQDNYSGTTELLEGENLDQILAAAEKAAERKKQDTVQMYTSTVRTPDVLAQILGFKFRHYQAPDVSESTPHGLFLTAAILIREGFIVVEDLIPHLSSNEEIEQVHSEYLAQVKSRISGAKVNQLAMAAPLESAGSATSTKSQTPPADAKKVGSPSKKLNQVIGLLNALLAIGCIRLATSLLSRYPWIVDADPEAADLILRIMSYSLAPFYESTTAGKERAPSFTQIKPKYLGHGHVSPIRKPSLTLYAPPPPSTINTSFTFFYPDWSDFVPICHSFQDVVDIIEPLMRFVGCHVSRDPMFITKLVRLARLQLNLEASTDPHIDTSSATRAFCFDIVRRHLIPALSLIRGNAVCTVDIWAIVKTFDISQRWRLYGEWKTHVYSSHPELRIRKIEAEREAKGILRRLSSNTYDNLTGLVAKTSHGNPCIFFANAINQVMAYDNLGHVVIQAMKYATTMGFDVLVYITIDALANPDKGRVKEDGVNTSDWLQSLASFVGMLYKRYNAELVPLLNYIVHQLQGGQGTDIVIFRELIWKMAGIEPLPSLSDSQIAAMAGGPALRIEAVASTMRGARMDSDPYSAKAAARLGSALTTSGLAVPLLIQTAQQQQSCVFSTRGAYTQSLASLYDISHGVLLQYLELLTTPSVIDYSDDFLPTLGDLGEKFGISARICMQIIRPILHRKLMARAKAMDEKERLDNEAAEKRLKAALTAKKDPAAIITQLSPTPELAPATQDANEMSRELVTSSEVDQSKDVKMELSSTAIKLEVEIPESPWLTELSDLFDDVRRVAPKIALDIIGVGFYFTFWQLSSYDLAPPTTRYDEEVTTMRNLSRQEDALLSAAERSSDRSRRSAAASHRMKRDRYTKFGDILAAEFKDQTVSRSFTIKRLAREKSHWFREGSSTTTTLMTALIEYCFLPRCLLSPMDADFCAQMIKLLHTMGTPRFWTLRCYDGIFGTQVGVILFSCSEYEAKNYGRFLHGALSDLWKWHQDEDLFNQDNRVKVGGKVHLSPGFTRAWTPAMPVPLDKILPWSDFKVVLRKWHQKVAKSLKDCIETGEFMHVYNAIMVLKEILPVFPMNAVANDTGNILEVAMKGLVEKEERENLKILARAYSASLEKRKDLWKPLPKITANMSADIHQTTLPVSALASSDNPSRSANSDGRVGVQVSGISTTTRQAIESIPRPEVVKRVRPDKAADAKKGPFTQQEISDAMDVDGVKHDSNAIGQINGSRGAVKDEAINNRMLPPAVPSQTAQAQGLRETAKSTIVIRGLANEARSSATAPSSPRTGARRSSSPSSKPGTRNHSNDSRASGGRRSDRGSNGDDLIDEKISSRSSRDIKERSRRDQGRTIRDRSRDRDRDRVTDRDKDRDRERDRGSIKDRGERDRHGERDRDRGDRRHGDRDRDRDRRRKDDKERPIDSRKDRDEPRGSSTATNDDRDRNATLDSENANKRRRPSEDDKDRNSRRGIRKESLRDEKITTLPLAGLPEKPRTETETRITAAKDSDGRIIERQGTRRNIDVSGLPASTPRGPRNDNSRDHRGRDPPAVNDKQTSTRTAHVGPASSLQSRLSGRDEAHDGDTDTSKKRNHDESDRESTAVTDGRADPASKRPKLNRNRYIDDDPGLAIRRTLGFEPDKNGSSRR